MPRQSLTTSTDEVLVNHQQYPEDCPEGQTIPASTLPHAKRPVLIDDEGLVVVTAGELVSHESSRKAKRGQKAKDLVAEDSDATDSSPEKQDKRQDKAKRKADGKQEKGSRKKSKKVREADGGKPVKKATKPRPPSINMDDFPDSDESSEEASNADDE